MSEEGDLGRRTTWGVLWSYAGTATGKGVSLLGMAVLARLLAPEHFGLLGFALVYLTYLEALADLGAGMALIYWPGRREDAAEATFWLSLCTGFLWTGLTWLLAPWVADFFRNPDGLPILRALAWTFAIKGFGNAHDALSRKDLRFRARLLPEIGMPAVKLAVSWVLALRGYEVWALVWGQLAGQAAWTLGLWAIEPWRPRWRFPLEPLRPLLRYGRGIVAVNLLAVLTHHVDNVIVGRTLGATALGFYMMASRIPDMSVTLLIQTVSRVLFPAFAKVQGDAGALRASYVTALRYVALLVLPASAALIVLALPVTVVLFGDTWAPAAPLLQALMAYASFRALGSNAGDVLKAVGRTGLLAWLGVLKAVCIVPALILAVRWGALAVAWTLAAVTALTLALNLVVIARVAAIPLRTFWDALKHAALGTAVLTLVLLGCRLALGGLPGLALAAILGGAAYLLVLRVAAPGIYGEVREALLGRRIGPPEPVSEHSAAVEEA